TWKTATIVLENRYSWLGPVALLAMPLYLRLGYTTLTETTAGLYAIAGTWLLASDRPRRAALVLSLVPLTRHEGILLLPAGAILLAWRGSWSSLPLLAFGEIAWNLAKPALGYPLSELPILRFAGRGDPGHLGYGGPLHYLGAGAQAFGIVPLMLGVVGAIVLLRRWWRDEPFRYRPALAGLLLCAGGLLSLIAIQTVLFMVNTHESGGYARFLLPAAPWAAVCVAATVSAFADADHATRRRLALIAMVVAGGASLGIWFDGWSPWPFAMTGLIVAGFAVIRPTWTPRLAAALASLAAVQMAIAFRPHRLLDHQRTVVDVTESLRRAYPDAHVIGDNPWTDFAADVARHPYFWAPNDWRRPPSLPLIYVWDADHSMVNLPLDDLTALPHRELATDDAYVRVFERIRHRGDPVASVEPWP
ncbi:MAG: hypothetical protein AAF561_10190, partial [Planctomycetota bacterium]